MGAKGVKGLAAAAGQVLRRNPARARSLPSEEEKVTAQVAGVRTLAIAQVSPLGRRRRVIRSSRGLVHGVGRHAFEELETIAFGGDIDQGELAGKTPGNARAEAVAPKDDGYLHGQGSV